MSDDERFTVEQILAIDQYYARIRELTSRPSALSDVDVVDPKHIAEASGLFVQLQQIWNGFGKPFVDLFLETLGGIGGTYVRGHAAISHLLSELGVNPDVPHMNAIVTWCMLGRPAQDIELASPSSRLLLLQRALRAGAPVPLTLPIHDLYREWDEHTGLGPTLKGVADSLQDDASYLVRLANLTETCENAGAQALAALAAMETRWYREFAAARRRCIERFVSNPLGYINPEQYLDDVIRNEYTRPPLLIVTDGGWIEGPGIAGWGKELSAAHTADDGTERLVVTMPPVQLPGTDDISNQSASELFLHCTIADVLFAEARRDFGSEDFDIAAKVLGDVTFFRVLT
jgi:hypothetical protein